MQALPLNLPALAGTADADKSTSAEAATKMECPTAEGLVDAGGGHFFSSAPAAVSSPHADKVLRPRARAADASSINHTR
jgi:hypothetical protein